MTQEDGAIEAKSVHVFAGCGVDLAGSSQHGALGLGFGRGNDVGNTHELQELLTLGIVLSRDSHRSPRELLYVLGRSSLFGLLEILVGFGFALESFGELSRLELRWGAVEDVEGFDTIVNHAQGTVEHAHQMRGSVSGLVCELLTVGSDSDKETVDAHGADRILC